MTVFATVITIAFSAVVGQSASDRNLAIQIAAARNSVAIAGSSVLGGTVVLLTNGAPVAGVTVELFDASATTVPVKQTATGSDGTWQIDQLPSGSYLFRVSGAGFAEIWYPAAASASDATEVTVQVGQQITDLQVALGGLPASVSGLVVGSDVAGAVLTVQVPVEFLPAEAVAAATTAAPDAAAARGDRSTRGRRAEDGADRHRTASSRSPTSRRRGSTTWSSPSPVSPPGCSGSTCPRVSPGRVCSCGCGPGTG